MSHADSSASHSLLFPTSTIVEAALQDIHDADATGQLGVQCKHHNANRTATPAEMVGNLPQEYEKASRTSPRTGLWMPARGYPLARNVALHDIKIEH